MAVTVDNREAYERATRARIRDNARKGFHQKFVPAHPEVDWEYLNEAMWGSFAWRLVDSAKDYGKLSEKQLALVIRNIAEAKERDERRAEIRALDEARKAQLLADGVMAPEGKVVVTGVIRSIKEKESQFGTTLKMLVETAEGWKVWGSLPTIKVPTSVTVAQYEAMAYADRKFKSADGEWHHLNRDGNGKTIYYTEEPIVGDTVSFSATLERSDSDLLFAFFKRPTKAVIVARAEEEVK